MNTKNCDKKVEALIETLWNDATDNQEGDCDDCAHNVCWDEHHPYGSTTATERLCECRVPDQKDCPVVKQIAGALDNAVNTITRPEENP